MPTDANRVACTSTTAGPGALTLGGAIIRSQSFGAAFGTAGSTDVSYVIEHDDANEWEVGLGTFLGPSNQLQRDTPVNGSAGADWVNFSAGSKTVYVARLADASAVFRAAGPTDTPITLHAASGQTAPMLAVYNSAGDLNVTIAQNGALAVKSAAVAGRAILSGSSNHLRLKDAADTTGVAAIVRTDSAGLYVLLTANNDADGSFNSLRPFTLDKVSGGIAMQHGLALGGAAVGSGLTFGVQVATSVTDLQRHIALYSTTYGFNVTSDRLNYNAALGANHIFLSNGVEIAHFNVNGLGMADDTYLHCGSYYIAALDDGTQNDDYISIETGKNFNFRSGFSPATNGAFLFRGSDNSIIARMDATGTGTADGNTLMTRQKADARFASISSLRYKDGVKVAARVPGFLDLDIYGWTFGGSLAEDDFRRGRRGYGHVVEDLVAVFPEGVDHDDEGRPDRLNVGAMLGALHAEIRHLSARLDAA